MGNGMNKVLPGLYIGNFRDSKDKDQLTENNITHIVSAHDNANALLQGYVYHCINVADSVGEDLTPYFEGCAMFIHRARAGGGNVLVHCPNSAFKRQLYEFGQSQEIKTLKTKMKQKYPMNDFDDEAYLRQVVVSAGESQPKLLQQFEDEVNAAAKYTNASTANTNRNVRVLFDD